MNDKNILEIAKSVIETEIKSIQTMLDEIDSSFIVATQKIHQAWQNKYRIVLTGIGKSGIIAQKISASFSSTGIASFYLHPVEATHGDLGMIQKGDIVIAFSHSGESEEILQLIGFLKENQNFLIAICGNKKSSLAQFCDCFLYSAITKEACPFNLTPTSSTTCALVMGDALVVALMSKNNFTPVDFAKFHPKGSLGRRLLTKVSDVMLTTIPKVNQNSKMSEIIAQMSMGRSGCVLVFDQKNSDQLLGIITDGDLRRALEKNINTYLSLKAQDICTNQPICINQYAKLEEAKNLMNQNKITCLVVKKDHLVIGLVQLFNCEI